MNNYVMINTPIGNIIMKYNYTNEKFEYFSNTNVPYQQLETVRLKYEKLFCCNSLNNDYKCMGRIADVEMFNKPNSSHPQILDLMAKREDDKWNKIREKEYNSHFNKMMREQVYKKHSTMNGVTSIENVNQPTIFT